MLIEFNVFYSSSLVVYIIYIWLCSMKTICSKTSTTEEGAVLKQNDEEEEEVRLRGVCIKFRDAVS